MAFNKVARKHHLIDAVVILLHVTFGMSMLQVWVLDPFNIPFRLDLIFITFIAYIVRFDASFGLFKRKNNSLLFLFIIIYFADFVQNFFTSAAGSALVRLITLLDLILFMEYIYAMYLEAERRGHDFFSSITAPYSCYSLYNLIVVLLCAVLIFLGVLSPYDNPMELNSLISDNVSKGAQYFFPGHLSVVSTETRALSYFNIPLISGLSHEPHVLLLILGPSFFIILRKIPDKMVLTLILYLSFLLLLVIASSVTAIIVFVLVISIEQFYSLSIGKRKTMQIILLLIFAVLVIWLFSRGGDLIAEAMYEMITEKTSFDSSAGGSGSYSVSMLSYMISPRSLFGSGNIPQGLGQAVANENIGLISCVLDVSFFIIMFVKTFRNVMSKNITCHYWGLACLYFLLHMQKLSFAMFSFPLLAFFVVMTIIMEDYNNRKNIIIDNSKEDEQS